MAEGVGFEPTVPFQVQQFSKLPDSTTLAPFLYGGEDGIRTRESISALIVFKTIPFNHSGTSPMMAEEVGFEPTRRG